MRLHSIRQCPRCVLRFGSTSELEQHLRLDHPPAAEARREEPNVPAARHLHAPTPGQASERQRRQPRRIRTAAIAVAVVLVAAMSWQLAVVLSVALVAAMAVTGVVRHNDQEVKT